MEEPRRRPYTWATIWKIVGMAWGSASYGYAASIIATTLGQPSFLQYMGLLTAPNAADLIGTMNGLFFAGGFIGVIGAGKAADKWGRKTMIIAGTIIILISNALLAGSVNVAMFIVFRFTQGIGAFVNLAMVPLWITEVVPPKDRGVLVDIHPILINVGYVTASYVGVGFYYYQGHGNEWRAPLALGCLPCVICLVATYFAPESPRYLVTIGQNEKAQEIIRRLHSMPGANNAYADGEFALMKDQILMEQRNPVSWKDWLSKKSYGKRFAIGCGLPFLLQSSGVLVINNYGTLLYGGLGFGPEAQLQLQAGWLVVSFCMNVLAVLIVDRLPRHHLITIGLIGALASLCAECAIQAQYLGTTNQAALRAGVAMLYVYVFFYGVFLDGPTFFYLGEIFPTHLRAQGMTMGMASLCLADIIWLQAAPTAFKSIGWRYYLFFIVITALGTVWVFFTFPDTRNLPLEEIGRLFGDEVISATGYNKDTPSSDTEVCREKVPGVESEGVQRVEDIARE